MFQSTINAIRKLRASRMGSRAQKALQQGELTKCVVLNREALKLMEDTFGDIPQTMVYAWNLAEAYVHQGQHKEAERYYKRVLKFVERDFSRSPFSFVTLVERLSNLFREQGLDDDLKQLRATIASVALISRDGLIKTQYDLDEFVRNYYQHKYVALISSAMNFLDRESDVPVETLLGAISGFFGQVFRDNSDDMDTWISQIDRYSERGQRLFLKALWISNTPKGKKYLEEKSTTATGDTKTRLLGLVGSEPPDLRTVVPRNCEQQDMIWGAFIASGDPIFVRNLIESATYPYNRDNYQECVTAAAGKWSLASNAQQHEIVYLTLKQQLDKYEGEKRKIIQDILDKAEMPNGPTLLKEEMQKTLEDQKRENTMAGGSHD